MRHVNIYECTRHDLSDSYLAPYPKRGRKHYVIINKYILMNIYIYIYIYIYMYMYMYLKIYVIIIIVIINNYL